MELNRGEMLGPYRLLELAGAGGMAEVWRAFQARLQRDVAIKVLPPHFAAQVGFTERFQQEALAISHLQHPHILPVFDFGQQGDFNYMVMPFIEGGTLADRLGQPWPFERALEVLEPLASALDHAHSHGIIHRDVKPSNVLLGEDGWILLGDFGVSKVLEATTVQTRPGGVVGTPAYMSPEQADGQSVGPASDLYSLGVIAYQLLTGQVPFQAETPIAVAMAQVHKPLPPPREVNPGLPQEVDSILLRALAKDPAQRFPSGEALVNALAAAAAAQETPVTDTDQLGSPTVRSAPPRMARRWGAWAPAWAIGIGAIGLLALLAIVFVVIGRPGSTSQPAGPDQVTPEPPAAETGWAS